MRFTRTKESLHQRDGKGKGVTYSSFARNIIFVSGKRENSVVAFFRIHSGAGNRGVENHSSKLAETHYVRTFLSLRHTKGVGEEAKITSGWSKKWGGLLVWTLPPKKVQWVERGEDPLFITTWEGGWMYPQLVSSRGNKFHWWLLVLRNWGGFP